VSENLFVLALDTLYYNYKLEVSDLQVQMDEQLAWFEEQLFSSEPEDKFILLTHIYETADYWQFHSSPHWNENKRLENFYKIMWFYKDQILIEMAGHDHLADLRAHSDSKFVE
jgi:hypothetical protein